MSDSIKDDVFFIEYFEQQINNKGYGLVRKPQLKKRKKLGTINYLVEVYGQAVYLGKRRCKKLCYYAPPRPVPYFENPL